MENIEALIGQYRDSASAHGKATLDGDYKTANRNYHKLTVLIPKINAYGSTGDAALLALTKDQNESVACWAATHSLKFDEKHALAVLDELSQRTGPMGFNARMVIQEWKKSSNT